MTVIIDHKALQDYNRRVLQAFFQEGLTKRFAKRDVAPTPNDVAEALAKLVRISLADSITVRVDPDTCAVRIGMPDDVALTAAVAREAMKARAKP